ncbi:MAG TPA: hypothetical protein VF746_14555 [Longimicrobium sp.]|jgi:hypothetical protein
MLGTHTHPEGDEAPARRRHGGLHELLRALLRLLFGHHRRRHRLPPPHAGPLGPGAAAPPVTLEPAEAHARFRDAFVEAAGAGGAGGGDVVWAEGDDELLVHAGRVRVVFREGFALVGIPVHTGQTGEVEVVVPFALGSAGEPLGLTAATEPTPRGPAALVEVWGDPLIATAWGALLRVAGAVAAGAGVDDRNQPLHPGALAAGKEGLTVTPQARHAFDREP